MSSLSNSSSTGSPVQGRSMTRRPLGHTGWDSPLVILGGVTLIGMKQDEANRFVAQALDAGVNQFDVAPTYGDCEVVLGRALPGNREQVFIDCKTTQRTKDGAATELRNSLQRLGTEYIDLYQFHALDSPDDLETVLGPGGAMEAFQEAKQQGRIRFIGITGHRPDNILAALGRYDFDTVMFPVNFVIRQHSDYGKALLAKAKQRDIGVMAIKALASRRWQEGEHTSFPNCWYKPVSSERDVNLAVRFTLSQPVTAIIPSGDPGLFSKALWAAANYSPLAPDELEELRARAAHLQPIFP